MREPKGQSQQARARIALISGPWHLANRPSLAVSALKAYLQLGGVCVDDLHLHAYVAARLGEGLYARISQSWSAGEALFSALAAPEESAEILARLRVESGGGQLAGCINPSLCEELAAIVREGIELFQIAEYDIAGVSVCHQQLMAALFLLRELKKRNPAITVVFGGSGLAGDIGRALMERVPELDFLVDGEGEEALLALCRLSRPYVEEELSGVPNLRYRSTAGWVEATSRRVLPSLQSLPLPDYSGFFALAESLGIPRTGLVLPLEASRGCEWEYRCPDGLPRGCSFCSLNRNWPVYREKGLAQVLAEVERGVGRYNTLDLAFHDTSLPRSFRRELLRELAGSGRDLTVFCEMRADFGEEDAALLASAGARRVQIGVESFSSSILERIGKGVRALDNVGALKLCEEYGIPYQYNLLTHVPGTTEEELSEMLRWVPLLYGLRPPHPVRFYLARDSRMHRFPEQFGIDPDSLDQKRHWYLPEALACGGVTTEVSYRASSCQAVNDAWDRLTASLGRWHEIASRGPALTYRDGGDFLAIEDYRGAEPQFRVLEGLARRILLAARCVASVRTLCEMPGGVEESQMRDVLHVLQQDGLLLCEGSRVLALPVRARRPDGGHRREFGC